MEDSLSLCGPQQRQRSFSGSNKASGVALRLLARSLNDGIVGAPCSSYFSLAILTTASTATGRQRWYRQRGGYESATPVISRFPTGSLVTAI
jgi:hypothetical protein